MQEALGLSKEKWDFGSFYSENPDADTFLCKVLAASAVAIYLDIISRIDLQLMALEAEDSAQRVNQLFNIFWKKHYRRKIISLCERLNNSMPLVFRGSYVAGPKKERR